MIAAKLLIPAAIGGIALFALSPKAKAAPKSNALPATGSGAPPKQLSTSEVVDLMTKALASGDPEILNKLADQLQAQGFTAQAADLRGVAQQLQAIGQKAAGVPVAPAPATGPATPPAAIPTAPPGTSVAKPDPLPVTTPGAPPFVPPSVVVSKPSNAAASLAQQVAINQSSTKKWKDNRDLTTAFQAQESALGHYRNVTTGEPGKVDGLYGPGTALALAEFYGIVPPNPKYWPTNPAPSLSAYRARLLKLAAADPARASEWTQAAGKAKV